MDRKQIHDAIHSILIAEWDPIGVNAHPEAQNEYDNYIGGIYRLMMAGADEVRMSHHLRRLERDSMGLSAQDEARSHRVAEMLLALVK
jgi:hypothetical protein